MINTVWVKHEIQMHMWTWHFPLNLPICDKSWVLHKLLTLSSTRSLLFSELSPLIRRLWLAVAPVTAIHSCFSVPQELLRSSQGLSEEREEVRRRLTEATDRVRQLEEDLLGVTQRGLQKETELDWWVEHVDTLASIIHSHDCSNDCFCGGVVYLLVPRHLHHSTRLQWVDKITQSTYHGLKNTEWIESPFSLMLCKFNNPNP